MLKTQNACGIQVLLLGGCRALFQPFRYCNDAAGHQPSSCKGCCDRAPYSHELCHKVRIRHTRSAVHKPHMTRHQAFGPNGFIRGISSRAATYPREGVCYRNIIAGHSTAFGVRFVQQTRSFTLRLFTQHFLNNLHWSHLSPFAPRDALQHHKVHTHTHTPRCCAREASGTFIGLCRC